MNNSHLNNSHFFRTGLFATSVLALVCVEAVRAEDSGAAPRLVVAQKLETMNASDQHPNQLEPVKPASPTYLHDVLPILMSKCARCHGDESSVLPNWLDYQTAFGDRAEIQRRVWHSWKGSYYKQPMPAGNNLEAQTMTEAERRTIKQWVENGALRGVLASDVGFHTKGERMELGRRLFGTVCAPCHQTAGQGIPARFPPLANSDFLNADKQRAIQIVVHGLQGELVVNGRKFNNAMPQFPLDNQAVANVLTYVYNAFGNSGKEVTAAEVSAVRSENTAPNVAKPTLGAKVSETQSLFE
jgi:mono/diheme cytochrome c family protein